MEDLGLIQAWDMWWDDAQVNDHTLYGWSILALGRAGKVLAFVAGMTVVLDLVDPERIRKLGAKHAEFDALRLRFVGAGAGGGGSAEAVAAAAAAIAFSVGDLLLAALAVLAWAAVLTGVGLTLVVRALMKGLASKTWEPLIRWSALILLVVGFHFDLLAS
ncbi:hypothetical protein ACQEVF_34150 [Nonomuraea polychroma]|uniref:hypothetical protein n=1 Tax=Nonomuraea polychroma TaxID=46176 RepID=UPI003D907C0D